MVRKAMALFDSLGVTQVLHCGDVGGMDVFDEMAGRKVAFVWGNTDEPEAGAEAYLHTVGIAPPREVPVRLECDGKRIAMFHGHEEGFARALRALDVDYLFHGHTHVARDEKFSGKRVINPGALHRAARKTVATLDTVTDCVTFHEVGDAR
jgi:putative phosphoesterase